MVLKAVRQALRDRICVRAGDSQRDFMALADEGSDCQSTERKFVSKILSRAPLARAMSARNRPEAAVEIAIFSIERPPGKRAPVRPSRGVGHARSSSQRRSADRPVLRGQTVSE